MWMSVTWAEKDEKYGHKVPREASVTWAPICEISECVIQSQICVLHQVFTSFSSSKCVRMLSGILVNLLLILRKYFDLFFSSVWRSLLLKKYDFCSYFGGLVGPKSALWPKKISSAQTWSPLGIPGLDVPTSISSTRTFTHFSFI